MPVGAQVALLPGHGALEACRDEVGRGLVCVARVRYVEAG